MASEETFLHAAPGFIARHICFAGVLLGGRISGVHEPSTQVYGLVLLELGAFLVQGPDVPVVGVHPILPLPAHTET